MADDDTATLILKPSLLTFGAVTLGAVVGLVVLWIWARSEFSHGGSHWDFAIPLFVVIVGIIQGYRSLRPVRLILTPATLSVIAGRSAKVVPWRDIEAIQPKRIREGRGSSLGTVIERKTRGDIRLRDIYRVPRQEVYGFLTGYAAVHAPHVRTAGIEGPPGV